MRAALLNGIHIGQQVAFEPPNDRPVDGVLASVQHLSYGSHKKVMLTVTSDNWRWTGHVDVETDVRTERDLPEIWDNYE